MLLQLSSLIVWLSLLIFGRTSVANPGEVVNATGQHLSGYGFEMVLAKLDYLQYKMATQELGARENTEEIAQKQHQLEGSFQSLLWTIGRLEEALAHNLTALQEQSRSVLSQQTACSSHEKMRAEIAWLASNSTNAGWSGAGTVLCPAGNKGPFRSCKEEPSKVSGAYLIQPEGIDEPFLAYCEQNKFGGGWLVVQHRFNGSLSFDRNWRAYRDGFGRVEHEHWLGLERLHRLTMGHSVKLVVELENFAESSKYAWYGEFVIGSEREQYPLKSVSGYKGTAGDSLTQHKGMKFTTIDRDNDLSEINCATNRGGWWYTKCHPSNLNGLYVNRQDWSGIIWKSFSNAPVGLAYSRMMIR